MKIYFAGPLFTPYVRDFISQHAQILRDNGIDPFVPHESFKPEVSPEILESLVQKGLITQEALEKQSATDLVLTLVRKGRVKREELGLPPVTPEVIFEKDMVGVASANAVVALLDGTQVDDGTACEIGIFCGLMRTDPAKKGIIGFMTDSRGLRRADHSHGINLFVLGAIEECGMILDDFQDVIKQLQIWEAER
ncbi:MAG TPA: nucleoside 2-deoxyribosyltransferase [Anaerolineae bacterium]|nr:nucleoside 2-deoxyribosyltransferase [Anaerolineae bacterium]